MKIKDKILSAVLIVSMAFSIAGCSADPETVIEGAKTQVETVESYRMNNKIDVEIKSGEYTSTTVSDYKFDIIESPVYEKIEMVDNYDGEEISSTMYIVEDEEVCMAYICYDTTWIKQPLEMEYFGNIMDIYNFPESIKYLLNNADSYDVKGTETFEGNKYLKGTLIFNEENLNLVFNELGVLSSLGLGEIDESLLEGVGNLEINVLFDKETYMPVKYSFDITSLLQKIVDKVYEEYYASEESAENTETEETITIGKYGFEYSMKDVNLVEAEELPEDVKNAVNFEEYYTSMMNEYYSDAYEGAVIE